MFWRPKPDVDADDLHQLARQLAALAKVATDLDGKLPGGGLDGTAASYLRVKGVLDALSGSDLAGMTARVQALLRGLGELDRRIAALLELKRVLERVDEPR